MVFSSIPAYLDSSNWHQQQTHQIIGNTSANPLLPPPPQPTGLQTPPPPQPHGGGGGDGSIRPRSMSERARMDNIQLPEMALICPRCQSTNTKFCYFNNYSLLQPRHFCKTCRRYWTKGGALRNVPVGGGCRRNKRSKSTSSKSPASRDDQVTSNSTSSMSTNSGAAMANILGLNPPLRFMSPLSQLTDNFTTDNLGFNYKGISTAPMAAITNHDMNFHGGGGMANLISSGNIEPWRLQQQMQQFPFMGGFDSSMAGIYGGESGFIGGNYNQNEVRPPPKFSSSRFSQMTSVKMEDHHNNNFELNLSRGLYGGGNQDQWNAAVATAAWTDLSSFSSSSTSNPF